MLLTEFSVENFGVFRGKHVFDLRVEERDGRPLVLFGGKNGSGKTTLFEGIKLCLYGRAFRGRTLPQPQYESYLRSKIHRRFGLAESEGSCVGLEFEHVHQGRISTYFVRRRWLNAEGELREGLEVLKDGKPPEGLSSQQLQDFLIELIPIGLSKLFFFDGEQIQKLAEDEPDNRNLRDAFNSLLGIDVLEHLQTDLRIHLDRQLRDTVNKPVQSLESFVKDGKILATEAAELRQEKAQKQTQIDHLMSEIERKEHQLAFEGGGFADRHLQLRSKKNQIEKEIMSIEDNIRELASSILPFAIVPSLCESLRNRLSQEEEYQREMAAKDLLNNKLTALREHVESGSFWTGIAVPHDFREFLTDRFLKLLASEAAPPKEGRELVHRLSPGDQLRILNWIEQSTNRVPVEFRRLSSKLESCTRELQTTEEALSRVPPDEAVSPIIQGLNDLHQQLGEINQEMSLVDERIRQVHFKQEENERRLKKLLEENQQIRAAQVRVTLGRQVQTAMGEFAHRLRKEKAAEVSECFADVFNQLSSKKNFVSRIHIDPSSFWITLFRRNGTTVPKEDLSAGEKQVYAIAMLAALAKVSGKPLPFVIDTPLARLDSQHRTNLINRFFPSASHQVIVFSTDSEIDQRYFAELEGSISKTYQLRFNELEECTAVSSGYFWEHPVEVSA